VLIDYLFAKDGVRVEHVDVAFTGIRLVRGGAGFVPRSAEGVEGTLRVTLADLSAAFARPEIVNQLLAGVPGVARPDLTFANGTDGGIRIVGSVEALGRRIPITVSTRIRVVAGRLVISPLRLDGLPLLGAFPLQLPDLELPLGLPFGLAVTDVTTEPGALVLAFAGTDLVFAPPDTLSGNTDS
jgi:LmeA-like phospholipid-binding